MAGLMNSADKPSKPRASAKYESLTPLEAALLDLQADSNDRMVAALERLETKVPSPRLIMTSAGSLVTGVLVLIVYVVSLLAQQRGVDVGEVAGATKEVAEAIAPAPAELPVEAPTVPPAPPTEAVELPAELSPVIPPVE
jgi:hypothetical protein